MFFLDLKFTYYVHTIISCIAHFLYENQILCRIINQLVCKLILDKYAQKKLKHQTILKKKKKILVHNFQSSKGNKFQRLGALKITLSKI